jgi:MFS family permease
LFSPIDYVKVAVNSSDMTRSNSRPNILWIQVWGLAGLQAAITLTWLIYNAYLPQLLSQFGFPASLAIGLLMIESALGVIMEPLFGLLSDRSQFLVASRFPFISLGVILASSLFIAIPAVVTFLPSVGFIRGILPLMIIAWALAMTVFRSPAMALLGKYAIPANLPLAFSVVTFTGGVVGAFKGIANQFILSLGPIFAFAIASFVLLAAAFALQFFHPPETPAVLNAKTSPPVPIPALALTFGTAFSIANGSRLLMDGLGKILKSQFHTNDITGMMLGIGLLLAISSLPAGFYAVKIGNKLAVICGLGVTIGGMLMLISIGAYIPVILMVIAGFSLILNGVIPFVVELIPSRWTGLGIGIYFGGFSLAMSLFNLIFPQQQTMKPLGELLIGMLAFFLAGIFILVTRKPIIDSQL